MAAQTKIDKLMSSLSEQLSKEFEATSQILREGDKIVFPTWMSPSDVIAAIKRAEEEKMKEASATMEFDAHPDDALYAFSKAVDGEFGKLLSQPKLTMFGEIPAQNANVRIDVNETVNLPVGKAKIPAVPIVFDIAPIYDETRDLGGYLIVRATYTRLYEPLVKRIEATARGYLAEHSIFKGKAIDSSFAFWDVSQFDKGKLIFSVQEERSISANILQFLRNTEKFGKLGRLRRGILFYGPYGTGKTLTARYLATEAVANGWTFINVPTGADVTRAIRIARRYQPAVVFFEDIDAEVGGSDRTDRVNQILNTADGVLTKGSQVMLVMTTNHENRITEAMRRPGRIDAIIPMGKFDEVRSLRILRATGIDTSDVEDKQLIEAARDFQPAFIDEAVSKSMGYSTAEGREKPNGQDLLDALTELRVQWEWMNGQAIRQEPTVDSSLKQLVAGQVGEVMNGEALQEIIIKALEEFRNR